VARLVLDVNLRRLLFLSDPPRPWFLVRIEYAGIDIAKPDGLSVKAR